MVIIFSSSCFFHLILCTPCFRLGINQTGILVWPRSPSTGKVPSQFVLKTVTGPSAGEKVAVWAPAPGPRSPSTFTKSPRKSAYSWTMRKGRCPSMTQRQRLTFILTVDAASVSLSTRISTPVFKTTGETWPRWLSVLSREVSGKNRTQASI